MSSKRNGWDNAVGEGFSGPLKKETIVKHIFKTRDEARQAVFHYIDMLYNQNRRHTYNGDCRYWIMSASILGNWKVPRKVRPYQSYIQALLFWPNHWKPIFPHGITIA